MLLILDFDGVFVPYSSFWESLKEYGEKQKILINDFFINSIKKSITKNQEELNSTLLSLGVTDLTYLYNLYLSKVLLKKGAVKFLKFCNLKNIKYIIYSGASTERIIHTFHKFDTQFNIDDIYIAKSKNLQEIANLKKKLVKKYSNIDPIIYVDDYPPALKSGKKNEFLTIRMHDDVLHNNMLKNYDPFIDYNVNTFFELKRIVLNLLS